MQSANQNGSGSPIDPQQAAAARPNRQWPQWHVHHAHYPASVMLNFVNLLT
jgi:hypothetical protein